MEEIERLCDRVLLIDHGRVIAAGTVAELVGLADSRHHMEVTFQDAAPTGLFSGMAGVSEPETAPQGERMTLMLADLNRISLVLERAQRAGCPVLEFSLHSPNLSDAFMALTGHALRDTD
jgi:ABC-2 type transport system ATP-binding protein